MAIKNNINIYKGEAGTLNFGMTPSTLTTRPSAASATTIYVASTRGFLGSGTAYVLVGNVVTVITYTGMTDATLTGCASVPAMPIETLVTGGGTDITGWTITLTIRANPTDTAALLTLTPATIRSAAGGIFSFGITSAQTKTTLGVGDFAYDIQRVDVGSESVLSIGAFNVLQEVLYP